MDNPFKAAAKNIGNVYRDKETDVTYVMVQPEYSKYAIVSLFGAGRWQGLTEDGEVFVDTVDNEPVLEYIGKINSVKVKREIIRIREVMK